MARFHRIAGNLFFLVLLIYAIVYAAERVTYVDSAWQFFQRVNNESFLFPSGRYGVFFSELPLYLAVKLHVSFPVLAYVFSCGYIVLYYLVWRICTFTLKNHAAGMAIVLCTFMGVREGFLHPVTETHQCVVYSVLLYALLGAAFRNEFVKMAWVVFVTILVLFTHPVGVFTAGFAALFVMAEQKSYRKPLPWLVVGLLALISAWRFFSPSDQYDAAQYELLKASPDISLTDSGALRFLLMHFPHFYWLVELAGLIVITALLLRREWLKLILTVAGVLGYLAIACITFRNGDSSIMIERVFLPAFFMINLAFAHWITQETRLNKWIPMLLVVFFLVNGIRYINAGCLMYKKRVAYLDMLVQKGIAQGNDKYFLSDAGTDMEKILVPWALGTETLIYSKLKYDKCISISMKAETCTPESVRLTRDFCLPIRELNPAYFSLSAEPYAELR